jgi:hypothetical protein
MHFQQRLCGVELQFTSVIQDHLFLFTHTVHISDTLFNSDDVLVLDRLGHWDTILNLLNRL